MAKKTNTKITAKSGKQYDYYSIRRKVGMKKNKAGKWVPDYRLFYGESKKDAESKYQAFKNSVSIDAKKPFGEVAEWFINNVFSINDTLNGNTKTLYINAYKSVFESSKIAGQPLQEITGADIQAVISESNISAPQSQNVVVRLGF